jgi:hypothetical protein
VADAKPVAKRDCFLADSFSFGVERVVKESIESGGTGEINTGVGELQEFTIHYETTWPGATLHNPVATGAGR